MSPPSSLGIGPATTVLLVVDVQAGMVEAGPWEWGRVQANIAALIAACRRNGVEVVYVQHDGEPGDLEEPGTPGWEIHRSMAPAPGERVVRKRFNSAFRGTDLRAYLDERRIETLIIVGLQTEYCVDTTIRVAFEFGYRLVPPNEALARLNHEMVRRSTSGQTPFANGDLPASAVHAMVNRRILADRFAAMPTTDAVIAALDEAGR